MLYEPDVDYGRKNELLNFKKIETFFDQKIKELDYYNDFDFSNEDGTILIELKSRRCNLTDYNDTIVSLTKFNKSKKISKTKIRLLKYILLLFQ